uniref:Gypsy retrotransposon integrase-like protein 1 n=1 Tax=Tanacetum cinerariifolium TaxID=118510 RepID=A0A699H6B3_TANCI|nr:gypsy retrotransposon integrase-like protein 1 [Tanacetum cinerariifolium]
MPTQILEKTPLWTLYIDGASSNKGSGAGLILTDSDGEEITYALRFEFPASNNEAKYKALIAGLELAIKMEVHHMQVLSDSLLVTNHMKGSYEAREESMKRYLAKVTWMNPIVKYLKDGQLPDDPIDEVHFRSCGAHAGARDIAQKVVQLGYYWPTMYQDATHVVSTCRTCQEHTPILRKPQYDMTSIYSSWPFYQWGIGIVGPFPEAPGRVKFLVVAIDYFTKWVEAAPLATTTMTNILKFVWTNIVCRFGISGIINPPPRTQNEIRKVKRPVGGRIVKCAMGIRHGSKSRELTALREAKYKHQMEQYYNQKVRHRHLKVEDYVLRKNESSRQEGQKKLDPNWEGPYQVLEAKHPGTYIFADMHGKPIPRTWHASNLRKFYF